MATKAHGTQKRTKQRTRKMWQKAFLAELRLTGVVSAACEIAGVARRTVYDKRESDPQFKAAWDESLEESADWLEKEARRRAEEGTLKPIFYKGQLVSFEREYSDTLMLALLKANRPQKFSERLIIQVTQQDAELLKQHGLTAAEAFEQLIQNLHEAANA